MKIFTMKKKKAYALMSTILLMASIMLTMIPTASARSASDPMPDIDWNEFQDHYDPAIYGVYPQYDPTSPNIPAKALVYPGLPPGADPDYTQGATAYLSFRPNPVGVGQSVLVNCWVTPGTYHAFYGPDYKITIENPNGVQDVRILDSYFADMTLWFEFAPNMAGTWRLKFDFPGMYLAKAKWEDHPTGGGFFGLPNNTYNLYASIYYTPDSTDWQELEVQEDLVWSWPAMELPTDYWERPINAMNREWWSIAGNYPFSGRWYWPNGKILTANPDYKDHRYIKAPESAHIVWERQQSYGGLIGGESYYQTEVQGGTGPNVIYCGRCYQTVSKTMNGKVENIWQCYDLRTGEVYWEQLAAGYTSYFFGMAFTSILSPTNIVYEKSTSEEVPGATARQSTSVYLVAVQGGNLYKWDPWTGDLVTNVSISPVSSGTIYYNDQVLSVQNMGGGQYRLINWTMRGSSSNFASRVLTNITWPLSGLGTTQDFDDGYVVDGWWNSPPGPQWCFGAEFTAVDLFTGDVLWQYSTNDTLTEGSMTGGSTWVTKDGILGIGEHNLHWIGYNLEEQTIEWESEMVDYPWGAWWPYNTAAYDIDQDQSVIVTSTYEGVYAIDFADGDIVWTYKNPRAVPFENPYHTEDSQPAAPFFTGVMIADGKVYAYNGEHTASQPMSRDWSLHCIDAATGEGIWTIYNPMTPQAVADGYLVATDPYNGHLYVFGQGKSATTVTVGPKTIALGAPVLIEGTVLDQSPAQPGTPCVSKGSMTTQMEYLHLQLPLTGIWGNSTIEGVPVLLTAIHSDGTVYDLGTATTNGYYGTFSFAWNPPKTGKYEILASFNGDESYGSSGAATAVYVGPAPTPAASIEPETPPPTTPPPTTPPPTTPPPTTPPPTESPSPSPSASPGAPPIITTEVAVILVVVIACIIGVAAYWMYRRRQ